MAVPWSGAQLSRPPQLSTSCLETGSLGSNLFIDNQMDVWNGIIFHMFHHESVCGRVEGP